MIGLNRTKQRNRKKLKTYFSQTTTKNHQQSNQSKSLAFQFNRMFHFPFAIYMATSATALTGWLGYALNERRAQWSESGGWEWRWAGDELKWKIFSFNEKRSLLGIHPFFSICIKGNSSRIKKVLK